MISIDLACFMGANLRSTPDRVKYFRLSLHQLGSQMCEIWIQTEQKRMGNAARSLRNGWGPDQDTSFGD